LKAWNNDPATAGIAVIAFTGWSQKNAGRRQQAVACAFLDIAELRLHEGCEAPLVRIVRRLKLEVPATPAAK
jgi:hypothetical protein